MKRERSVASSASEQFTIANMQDGALDDIAKEIFKRACSNDVKAIATFRSVCKHWYRLFNPAIIKTTMGDGFGTYKEYFLSLVNDKKGMKKIENNQDCASLLLDMIQDDTIYEELLALAIDFNFPQCTQLLLEKGTKIDIQKLNCSGNSIVERLFETECKEIFTLLVRHGLDIDTPLTSTNGSIRDHAMGEAIVGIAKVVSLLVLWPFACFMDFRKSFRPLITILKERHKTEVRAFGAFGALVVAMLIIDKISDKI